MMRGSRRAMGPSGLPRASYRRNVSCSLQVARPNPRLAIGRHPELANDAHSVGRVRVRVLGDFNGELTRDLAAGFHRVRFTTERLVIELGVVRIVLPVIAG